MVIVKYLPTVGRYLTTYIVDFYKRGSEQLGTYYFASVRKAKTILIVPVGYSLIGR